MRRAATRAVWWLLHLAIAVAVLLAAVNATEELWVRGNGGAAAALALAAVVIAAQIAVLALAWGVVLWLVSAPSRVPPRVVAESFVTGWLWRYLPGPPAGNAGKFLRCREAGAPAWDVGVAILYEQLLQLGAMILLPGLTAGLVLGRGAFWLAPLACAVAACIILPATSRAVVHPLLARASRLVRREHDFSSLTVVRPAQLTGPALLFLLSGVLGAVSFHLVAVALSDWPADHLGHSIFAFSLGSLAGYLVPFLPTGAGAREAVIVGALSPTVGPGAALSVAVVARAVAILVDAMLGCAVGASYLGGTLRRRFVSPPPPTVSKTRT